jgi:long-chain acyl-CoA synthetase
VPASVPKPTDPLHAALAGAARTYPDNPALDFFGKRTTYAQLWEQVRVAASALRARGVGPGTVVAIALPNCPQHVVAFYAVARLGGVVVEHNPTYGPEQFAHQLEDSGARVVIAWDKVAPVVAAAVDPDRVDIIAVDMASALPWRQRLALNLPIPKARRLKREMSGKRRRDIVRWEDLLRGERPLPAAVPGPGVEDLAVLQYTGGTTGTPKGAMLTHANLVVNATQAVAWVPSLVPGEEVFYGALPFFHAFGLTLCVTVPVRLGALLVLFPKFSVGMALAAQRRVPGTFFAGVPPMFDRLASAAFGRPPAVPSSLAPAPRRRQRSVDLTSFRHAISGAMATPAEVAQRWEEATGGLLVEGYGLTETSPLSVGNPVSEARRPGTLGVPFPDTEARIADLERPERDARAGEPGELWLRGPQVFSGYWNRPEETAECLTPDGWFKTGDIVVSDGDGFFCLVDRIKEVIITGGFNVYPSQVEAHLARMREIAEVAVIGLPHSDLGERVVAAVVLRAGAVLDLDRVRAWCADQMSRYAIPEQLVLLSELPRSQVGKVLRRVVRLRVQGTKLPAA